MSQKKINIVVAGATGYVGLDLVYYLSKHPKVNISYLCAQKNLGRNIKYFDTRILKNVPKISNLNNVRWDSIDLLFLSSSCFSEKLVCIYIPVYIFPGLSILLGSKLFLIFCEILKRTLSIVNTSSTYGK